MILVRLFYNLLRYFFQFWCHFKGQLEGISIGFNLSFLKLHIFQFRSYCSCQIALCFIEASVSNLSTSAQRLSLVNRNSLLNSHLKTHFDSPVLSRHPNRSANFPKLRKSSNCNWTHTTNTTLRTDFETTVKTKKQGAFLTFLKFNPNFKSALNSGTRGFKSLKFHATKSDFERERKIFQTCPIGVTFRMCCCLCARARRRLAVKHLVFLPASTAEKVSGWTSVCVLVCVCVCMCARVCVCVCEGI